MPDARVPETSTSSKASLTWLGVRVRMRVRVRERVRERVRVR